MSPRVGKARLNLLIKFEEKRECIFKILSIIKIKEKRKSQRVINLQPVNLSITVNAGTREKELNSRHSIRLSFQGTCKRVQTHTKGSRERARTQERERESKSMPCFVGSSPDSI